METLDGKTRPECNQRKARAEFSKNSNRKDGMFFWCKECQRKRDSDPKHKKARYEYRRSKDGLESHRKYRKTDKGRKVQKAAYQKHRENHPEKNRARQKLNYAVKTGGIIKPIFCRCGSPDGIEGHHHDYNLPLDVVWLCAECHRKEHGKSC